jgi:hypothetical protein
MTVGRGTWVGLLTPSQAVRAKRARQSMISSVRFTDVSPYEYRVTYLTVEAWWILPQIADFINLEGWESKGAWRK